MARWLAHLAFVICLAAFPAVLFARSDDDDLVDESKPVVEANRIINVIRFRLDGRIEAGNVSADIDNWVFGVDRSEEGLGETNLLSQLQRRVDVLARTSSLSKSQLNQLSLAGQGDIRRFMDRLDALKARLQSVARGPDTWQQIQLECRPLQDDFRRGVFASPSLFAKTMTRLMSVDQMRQLKKIAHDRRRFQHRAGVRMTVQKLSTALGLSDEQQIKLQELLLRETRPARLLEGPNAAAYFNVVYAQMPRIPEQKLRPLFEPWQWAALKWKLKSAAVFGGENLQPAGDEDDDVVGVATSRSTPPGRSNP
jgi:hypothetical protein